MPPYRTFVAMALTALFSLAAYAASPSTTATASAQQRYQLERAACAAKSGDDRRTCLKEADAALAAARDPAPDGPTPTAENALQRCKPLPDPERRECETRMRSGTVSGSVKGGGVLRELVTIVPAASAANR